MLIFYVLMTAALLSTFWMILRMRKVKRHDEVLYRFCELRRDAMKTLRDKSSIEAMTRQEYIVLRKLLETLNVIIEAYKTHKTVIFNLRTLVRVLSEYKRYNKKAESIEKTKHEGIEFLRIGIMKALLHGFLAYTPFIKSEVVVRVVLAILGLLAQSGVKKLNGYARSLKEALEIKQTYQKQFAC